MRRTPLVTASTGRAAALAFSPVPMQQCAAVVVLGGWVLHTYTHAREGPRANAIELGLPQYIWYGHLLDGALANLNEASHGR